MESPMHMAEKNNIRISDRISYQIALKGTVWSPNTVHACWPAKKATTNQCGRFKDRSTRLSRARAEAVLNSLYENYRKKLSDRLDYELGAAQEEWRTGNDYAAKHHDMLASIYRSLIERYDQKPPV